MSGGKIVQTPVVLHFSGCSALRYFQFLKRLRVFLRQWNCCLIPILSDYWWSHSPPSKRSSGCLASEAPLTLPRRAVLQSGVRAIALLLVDALRIKQERRWSLESKTTGAPFWWGWTRPPIIRQKRNKRTISLPQKGMQAFKELRTMKCRTIGEMHCLDDFILPPDISDHQKVTELSISNNNCMIALM